MIKLAAFSSIRKKRSIKKYRKKITPHLYSLRIKGKGNYTKKAFVCGSYPEAAEAKQTPVMRSLACSVGSRYGGRSSFIPSSSTIYNKYNQGNCYLYKTEIRDLLIF